MKLMDLILGRPLATSEDQQERVGSISGVSVFGLDALSSAAYGPEAALTVLIPLGAVGLGFGLPITIAVSAILAIVYFSYRQTIAAYPGGAGSYTVAKENLGDRAGLLGAVALMIDYTLNVAVGISAGIGALVSAFPALQPYTVWLCLGVLALLSFMNLRGLRESGLAFLPPTYLFVCTLGIVIILGVFQSLITGQHPQAVIPPPSAPQVTTTISLWLFLKAFAAGCTAMTGVEAVSNGVQAFREPVVGSARRDANPYRCHLNPAADRRGLPRTGLSHQCHRSGIEPVSEYLVHDDSGRGRPRSLLLYNHGCRAVSALSFGEHFFC